MHQWFYEGDSFTIECIRKLSGDNEYEGNWTINRKNKPKSNHVQPISIKGVFQNQ